MTLLDLPTKVRTFADWSPDVPRARIDMDALLADMRPTGVAEIDSFLAECLDGERVPFIVDYLVPRRIAGTLSAADGLRLLARTAPTSTAVRYLHLTCTDMIQADKARTWAGLLDQAASSIVDTKPQLDDRTVAALARAARISAPIPANITGIIDTLNVARILVDCTPEPMSDAQRRALTEVADLIDGLAWEPNRYANAILALEPLYRRLGRPFSDSALLSRQERAKETARLAFAYVCQETRPPITAWLEAICQRSPDRETQELQNSLAAEILASSPAAKGEALGMMAEANRPRWRWRKGKLPISRPMRSMRTTSALAGFPVIFLVNSRICSTALSRPSLSPATRRLPPCSPPCRS